jgi:hypothetical protein
MRMNDQHNAASPRWPKHMRWDRQRSDQDLHRMAEEYGKCWNPIHWHRLTQGYYDGFEDARTEYERRYDQELAAAKERHRAEIEELKANWIPPDEAEQAIQKIYALRKERDELLNAIRLRERASAGTHSTFIQRICRYLFQYIVALPRASAGQWDVVK